MKQYTRVNNELVEVIEPIRLPKDGEDFQKILIDMQERMKNPQHIPIHPHCLIGFEYNKVYSEDDFEVEYHGIDSTIEWADNLGYAIPKQKLTEDDTRKNLKNMTCPQCRKNFVLTYDDYTSKPATLILRGCPSGGIYDVRISCPHCDYEEEL